jgi:uncharacterized protein (DUF2267 family)
MSATGLVSFDRTVHTTNEWLNELKDELGWDDRQRAYHALRSVLHALRDRLTVEESAHLAAQLPTLIRGVFYEGWRPAAVPVKVRSGEEFLELVEEELSRDFVQNLDGGNTERITRAVFAVLSRRVSEGEIAEVKRMLPPQIRELWP